MTCRASRRPVLARRVAVLVLVAGAAAACSDPAPGQICALLAPPNGATHALDVAVDQPIALGIVAPGIDVLESADERFQPQARDVASALRALERGDDPGAVVAEHRSAAEALDAAVAQHCAS
ncbi:MAG: hypothetical protein R2699_03955 [Acidimicrobiales bacterium]|nr:hypothetical protein [Acidimicrobiales bacterium]MCB1249236.1 hypothetical protein [Acidimicrobiales bacterium]